MRPRGGVAPFGAFKDQPDRRLRDDGTIFGTQSLESSAPFCGAFSWATASYVSPMQNPKTHCGIAKSEWQNAGL
jgi:hypothetical protein